ncbi:MAG: tetratricopeptide repeat protein [Candidatus Omnitrophica bacterium]|nr:tetratricopeptide repeat protein [Candidatus Omnitrophota bacterium]
MIRNASIFLCSAAGFFIFFFADAAYAAGPANIQRMTDEQAIAGFVAAGAAYKAEDFASAVAQYQSIVDAGKESGALYYNFGNSYFKLGDLGRAILNYEKARRLIPRDSDLNYNYRYALAQMKEPATPPAESWTRRLLNGFIQFYTMEEMIIMLLVLGCFLGFLHLLSLYLKWPARTAGAVLSVLAAGWFLFFGAWGIKWYTCQGAAVVVEAGEAKFEPREDATTHFTLAAGMRIKLLKLEEDWAKIERPDGKMGWLPVRSFGLL